MSDHDQARADAYMDHAPLDERELFDAGYYTCDEIDPDLHPRGLHSNCNRVPDNEKEKSDT